VLRVVPRHGEHPLLRDSKERAESLARASRASDAAQACACVLTDAKVRSFSNDLYAKCAFVIELDARASMALLGARYNPAGIAAQRSPRDGKVETSHRGRVAHEQPCVAVVTHIKENV
jgi:hypothetical protein